MIFVMFYDYHIFISIVCFTLQVISKQIYSELYCSKRAYFSVYNVLKFLLNKLIKKCG